jgi:hypothetical protein
MMLMPWRSSEARLPSCWPWLLYVAILWPREGTKVIMVNSMIPYDRDVSSWLMSIFSTPMNFLRRNNRRVPYMSVSVFQSFWGGGFGPGSFHLDFPHVIIKIYLGKLYHWKVLFKLYLQI